jgi:hypothetical protein
MVEVDILQDDVQDALAPSGPQLHLVTATEGLTPADQVMQAKRAAGMLVTAKAMFNNLPASAIEDALADEEIPSGQREEVLGYVSSEIVPGIIFKRHGMGDSVDNKITENTGETAEQRNARVLARQFTEGEQARVEAILAQHRSQTAPQAGHLAVAAA